jgi:hypothetical protein
MAELFTVATCEKQEIPKDVPLPGKNRTVTAMVDGIIVELLPNDNYDHGTFTMKFIPDNEEEFNSLMETYAVGNTIEFEPKVIKKVAAKPIEKPVEAPPAKTA